MKKLKEKYVADFTIAEETDLSGMIIGDVIVTNEVIFVISGMLTGDLKIDDGSTAIIYGTVNGNIENYGECEIYGVINGNLLGISKQMFIDAKAKINNI
jgi:cytoskeletal protein CcmA (bactofilin family)